MSPKKWVDPLSPAERARLDAELKAYNDSMPAPINVVQAGDSNFVAFTRKSKIVACPLCHGVRRDTGGPHIVAPSKRGGFSIDCQGNEVDHR